METKVEHCRPVISLASAVICSFFTTTDRSCRISRRGCDASTTTAVRLGNTAALPIEALASSPAGVYVKAKLVSVDQLPLPHYRVCVRR